MRKLIIDTRIRSFAADYKTKLQNQCPDVVSDLEDLSKFVSSNNTFKDITVVKDYIDAIISAYPTLLTQEPKDWDLKKYNELTREELLELKGKLENEYKEAQAKGLDLDMSRGKPCTAQLDLSMPMIETLVGTELTCEQGVDCRNYGVLEGINEAKY